MSFCRSRLWVAFFFYFWVKGSLYATSPDCIPFMPTSTAMVDFFLPLESREVLSWPCFIALNLELEIKLVWTAVALVRCGKIIPSCITLSTVINMVQLSTDPQVCVSKPSRVWERAWWVTSPVPWVGTHCFPRRVEITSLSGQLHHIIAWFSVRLCRWECGRFSQSADAAHLFSRLRCLYSK